MTKRILLVDDEADIIFTMKDILEEERFKVDTFNDPTIALESYRTNFYDSCYSRYKDAKNGWI